MITRGKCEIFLTAEMNLVMNEITVLHRTMRVLLGMYKECNFCLYLEEERMNKLVGLDEDCMRIAQGLDEEPGVFGDILEC